MVYPSTTPVRTGLWSRTNGVVLVVGAERDVVRAVRDLESTTLLPSLSPDGTRLAGSTVSQRFDEEWPAVLITDLVNGRTERFDLPDPALGGEIERLTWSANGREVLVGARAVLEHLDEGGYLGDDRDLVLDTHTGAWRARAHGTPVALSPDGRLELRWDGVATARLVVAETDGPVQARLVMPTVDDVPVEARGTMVFSPDGDLIAVWGSRSISVPPNGGNPRSIEIFDASTGEHRGAVDLGGLRGGDILGWGEEGILALVLKWEAETQVVRFDVSNLPEVSDEVVVRHERSPEAGGVGYAGVTPALLDADVRVAEPPVAGFDVVPWIPWLVVGACVLTAGLLWAYRIRRR
jgi:hypothetical protein